MNKSRSSPRRARETHESTAPGVKGRRPIPFGPLLVLILVSVAVVWGLSEALRRLWLGAVGEDVARILQVARDIATSLLAATVVAWYLVRDRPSLFPPDKAAEAWPQDAARSFVDALRHYVRWFIRMRWIACLVAALLSVTVVKILNLLNEVVFWPLMTCVSVLAVTNLVYEELLRRGFPARKLVEVQIYLDLALLTALLHYSGGIENPLTPLSIFHVIIGGILLPYRRSYMIAGAASAMFAMLAFAEWGELVEHYTLLIFPHGDHQEVHAAHEIWYVVSRAALQSAVLFLTAYFITTIMERLRAEERRAIAMSVRATEERRMLERVVEATEVGLIVLDADLRPVWLNEQVRSWLHLPPGDLRDAWDTVRALLEWSLSPAAQTLTDGRTRVVEQEIAVPNRGNRQLQVTIAPIQGEAGQVSQIVELVQDVTDQRQAQARLVQASKMAAVGELAGSVAHEVNNPVGIISAKARLLLSDHSEGMSDKVRSDVGRIVDLADRVGRIAQGLLSYCRPSPAAKVPLDVRVPLKKSLALINDTAEKRGIELEEAFAERMPPVLANASELEQVFLNLLVNAIDAMPEGGKLFASVMAEEEPHPDGRTRIAVRIRDTGSGIPVEARLRIFEPFFTTKQEGRGTGLGLSICDGLVRSHGGTITADSDPGQGASFVVRLPVVDGATGEGKRG